MSNNPHHGQNEEICGKDLHFFRFLNKVGKMHLFSPELVKTALFLASTRRSVEFPDPGESCIDPRKAVPSTGPRCYASRPFVDWLRTLVIGLLQRVSEASVTVDGQVVGQIGRGLLVLIAVEPDDGDAEVKRMAERLTGYRVFPDEADRMNRSLVDENLELLLVPQFTLAADTRKGMRPSFTKAASPEKGRDYFDRLLAACRERVPGTASGEFGANMQVRLLNDGPVTFWLQT